MKNEALDKPGYLSYLLRLWGVQAGNGVAWRASLEPVGSDEQINFASLEALCSYLVDVTRNALEADGGSKDVEDQQQPPD
jgi:hypothetical protein